MMGFWRRSPNEDLMWQEVTAAYIDDNLATLKKALARFRKAHPSKTVIDSPGNMLNENKPGNSFAMAMQLLADTSTGRKNRSAMAQLLHDDWIAHGEHSDALLTNGIGAPFSSNIRCIVGTGEPQRIRLALSLCHAYLEAPDSYEKGLWVCTALSLSKNRTECLRELGPVNITPSDIFTFLQIMMNSSVAQTDPPDFPPPDKEMLETLWSLPKSGSDCERAAARYQCTGHLLNYRPAKSLLDAIDAPETLAATKAENCHEYYTPLRRYVDNNAMRPDAVRMAAEPGYRAECEDIRLGILQSYAAIRHGLFVVPSFFRSVPECDREVLPFTAFGLKERFEQFTAAPRSTETQHIRDELRLYQQTGLLADLFTLAGTSTGFATDLEFKTALREQIIPLLATPADRAQVLGTACWAEYVRTKPTAREGSAAANYVMGG